MKPTSYTPGAGDGLDWVLDPKDSCFNLSVLARTEENAMTLRSDFMVGGVVGGYRVGWPGLMALRSDFMVGGVEGGVGW